MFYDNLNFKELINVDSIYWFCALVGSGMFLIQFMLNLFGMAGHDSIDVGEAGIADMSDQASDSVADASDMRKLKWLSIQAMTGFLMVFGWTALTCHHEFGLQNTTTIFISLSTGLLAGLIIRAIFKFAKRLHSPGCAFSIDDTIGKEAYVYQSIPKDGVGKISLSLHNFTHEIDAVAGHAEVIPAFMAVKIIEKHDDRTVVVSPL